MKRKITAPKLTMDGTVDLDVYNALRRENKRLLAWMKRWQDLGNEGKWVTADQWRVMVVRQEINDALAGKPAPKVSR